MKLYIKKKAKGKKGPPSLSKRKGKKENILFSVYMNSYGGESYPNYFSM